MKYTTIKTMIAAVAVALGAVAPQTAAANVQDAKSVDIAVFVGNGARNIGAFRWIEIATRAKGCTVTFVDGATVYIDFMAGRPALKQILDANDKYIFAIANCQIVPPDDGKQLV